MTQTYIICSAVKFNDIVVGGRRHGDCFQAMEKMLPKEIYDTITRDNVVCGFIDNWGDFHTREEAWVIAENAEQIKFGYNASKPMPRVNFGDDKLDEVQKPVLISEHLFDDKEEF
jgi:hypothetical protein